MVYRRQQCLNNSRAVSPILSSFGKSRHAWIALLILQLPLQATSAAHKETAALWTVTFLDAQDSEQIVDGRVVVEAQDGGLMLEDRMGVLWNITPDRLVDRQAAGREFTAYSSQEVQAALLAGRPRLWRCRQCRK